jgi:zinc protease
MAKGHRDSVIDSLERLFDAGTVTGLSDAQLLKRFLAHRDESAFEAILHRHGPMVLGVCRRILDDPHDIADAFQTTFLILVKKARSIRERDVLGTWLYGVARRVAVRAQVNARRRSTRERNGSEGLDVELQRSRTDRLEAIELQNLLDAELERLPTRYRQPVILCDLEGQTHEQAAAEIGCPVGTVKSRLARGREQLRSRLVRRGVAPSAALLVSTIAADAAHAVPVEWINQTLQAAVKIAAGNAVSAGTFSAGVVTLWKGVLRSMFLTKLKFAAAAIFAATLTATGVWSFVGPIAAQPARGEPASGPSPLRQDQAPTRADTTTKERSVERFQLENGLKVILRPIKGATETALLVVYGIGSDHDPEGRSGLAQFVMFVYASAAAGTEKARTVQELDPAGANGQTGDRYTVISTSFLKKDLDNELRDAAARMNDLHITPADLARERPQLLQMVANMFDAFPTLAAVNHARELARPTAHGGRGGGLPEHLRALTIDDVQTHWKRYYKPRNAIVALAGDLDPAQARKAITAHFGGIPAGDALPPPGEPDKPKLGTFKEVVLKSLTPAGRSSEDVSPHACIAYPAPRPGSAGYMPFLVLVLRLWDGASKLGEGGVTGSPVYFTPLDDGSIVGVSAKVKPDEPAATAIGRLEAFVAKTIAPKLGDSEITAAREQIGSLMGLTDVPDRFLTENPYGEAFSLARREQLGLDPAELNRALDVLTDDDLRRAAAEFFGPSRHAGAVISIKK